MDIIDNIQICFVTTTQYQFMITDIYARYIFDKFGIKSVVFNRIFPNFDSDKFDTDGKYTLIPYAIHNKNIIGKCYFALRCGYLYSFSKWSKVLDPTQKTILFVFNDMSKLANRLMNQVKSYSLDNRIFIVDEGNSTYSDSIELKNEKLWRLKHQLSKAIFGYGRTSKVIGESQLIDGAIVREVEKYKKLNKSKNQDVRQQSKNILKYAAEFFDHYSSDVSVDINNDVIYLGQPFYQNGKFYKYEDDCIDAIMSVFPEDIKVLIKPHPRDLMSKYKGLAKRYKNVSVISNDLAAIPIEAIIGMAKTKIIITIQSSAAVTIANMYPGISSIVVKNIPQAELMLEKLRESGDEGPVFEDSTFVGKNGNVFLPKSLDELTSIIQNRLIEVETKMEIRRFDDKEFHEIDDIVFDMKGE